MLRSAGHQPFPGIIFRRFRAVPSVALMYFPFTFPNAPRITPQPAVMPDPTLNDMRGLLGFKDIEIRGDPAAENFKVDTSLNKVHINTGISNAINKQSTR